MPASFSQIKTGLDAISGRISGARARLADVKAGAQFVSSDLQNLGTEYATLITDINAAAAAAPSDVSLQNAKAEAAQLTAEFQAIRTVANAVIAAIPA